MVATVTCVHCGALAKHPVYKTINGQSLAFCCGGCVEVYEMLHEEGLDSVGQGVPEVTNSQPAANQFNQSMPSQTTSYHIAGMTCANCVSTVTRQLRSVPGVMEVNVVLETESAIIKMAPNQVSMADLKRAVEKAGYAITPEGDAR
jgi:P-type Cu2+ transporter